MNQFTNPYAFAVSKRDFAIQYPALVNLYQQVLERIALALETRRKADVAKFDAMVVQARSLSEASDKEARAAFRAALGDEHELVVRLNYAARDELNEKLALYLCELDVIERPIFAQLADQIEGLNAAMLAVQECYRDLEQPDLLHQELEALRLKREAAQKSSDAQRAGPRQAYSDKVQAAFDHFNATAAANVRRFDAIKEAPELTLKRALRRGESTLHDSLLAIAEERDQANFALQTLARSLREKRLQILEAFLQSGCADEFERALGDYCRETVAQLEQSV